MSFHKQLIQHKQLRTILILTSIFIGGTSFIMKSVEGLLAAFFIVNIASWVFIYVDKKKAVKRKPFRVPEGTFILFSLVGGALGALLGIYIHRHKTKHLRFTLGIPILLLLNIILFGLLFKYI
jgi:uncharacterized membrane protein YsdA (DUF1294 family)